MVDQWALVRVGIGTILRQMSIRVAGESARAAEGLALAQAEQADLLVLGSHLDSPVGDAVRSAKKLEPAPLVISLLSHPDRDLLAECLGAGADGVLLRSATDGDLSRAVGQVAEGGRWVAPALTLLLAGAVSQTGAASPLTAKEIQVLSGLAAGLSNKELAEAMFVSAATIKTHLSHIYAKLEASGRQEAVARAVELGLLA